MAVVCLLLLQAKAHCLPVDRFSALPGLPWRKRKPHLCVLLGESKAGMMERLVCLSSVDDVQCLVVLSSGHAVLAFPGVWEGNDEP